MTKAKAQALVASAETRTILATAKNLINTKYKVMKVAAGEEPQEGASHLLSVYEELVGALDSLYNGYDEIITEMLDELDD